jgi:hypothetical protein
MAGSVSRDFVGEQAMTQQTAGCQCGATLKAVNAQLGALREENRYLRSEKTPARVMVYSMKDDDGVAPAVAFEVPDMSDREVLLDWFRDKIGEQQDIRDIRTIEWSQEFGHYVFHVNVESPDQCLHDFYVVNVAPAYPRGKQ